MKIVLATPLYPPEVGGPATYAKALVEGLPSEGVEIELVKFSDVRKFPKLVRHIAYFKRVVKAAQNADVVLALDPVSTGLPALRAAKKAGKPLVVKIVGDYAWEQGRRRFGVTQTLDEFVRTPQSSWKVRAMQRIQTRVASEATRIIVPSAYLKSIVEAWGIPSDKIVVIYNGIELPRTLPEAQRPAGFFVVSSGRRVPWKGFESIERVVSSMRGTFFLAEGLSHEEALGKVKAADVYVLNSEYEGLSHALIEAMMLGTPIVATNVGGNPELIEDGKTGLLIPPRDEQALRAALQQIADDPAAAKTRAAAAQVAAQKFSMSAMLTQTAALLTSL